MRRLALWVLASGTVLLALGEGVRGQEAAPSRSSVLIQEVRLAGSVNAQQQVEATDPPYVAIPRTEYLNMFGTIPFGWARLEGSADARGDLLAPVLRGYAEARLDGARLFGRHAVDFFVDGEASGLAAGERVGLDLGATLAGVITVQGLVSNFDQGYARLTGRVLQLGAEPGSASQRLGWEQLEYLQIRLNPPNTEGLPEFVLRGEQRTDAGVTPLPFGGGAFASGERVAVIEVPVDANLRFEVELEGGAFDFNRSLTKVDLLDSARVALRPAAGSSGIVLGLGSVPVPEAAVWPLLAIGGGAAWGWLTGRRRAL